MGKVRPLLLSLANSPGEGNAPHLGLRSVPAQPLPSVTNRRPTGL